MTPRTDAFHLDYLLVVLHSALVMSEERFDALASEHLAHYAKCGRLNRLKEAILDGGHAHRFELRGRAYWARLRIAGTCDGQPAVSVHDVASLVDAMAREASRG